MLCAKLGVIANRQNQGIGKAIVEYIIETSYMFNERYIIGLLELNSKNIMVKRPGVGNIAAAKCQNNPFG